MASPKTSDAIKKSIFNAANLSGLGAVFLSYEIGAMLGTVIFMIAVIIGSYNKYKSVINSAQTRASGFFAKLLNDPSITAQILMVAAFINFVKTGYDGFISPNEQFIYFMSLSAAWFFGFMGDDSLRRNDKTNFSDGVATKELSLWMKTLVYVTRNPVFYYIISNIFFSISVLSSPNGFQTGLNTSLLEMLNILTITTCIIAVLYGLWKGLQMVKGEITSEQTNDGIINFIGVLITVEIGAMSLMQGLYWVFLAMVLYGVSNIVHLYETRHALQKEHS